MTGRGAVVWIQVSAPAQGGGDLGQDRLYDVGIVGDAELVGDSE